MREMLHGTTSIITLTKTFHNKTQHKVLALNSCEDLNDV